MRSKRFWKWLGMMISAVVFLGGCAAQNNETLNASEGTQDSPAVSVETEVPEALDSDAAGEAVEDASVQSLMAAGSEPLPEGQVSAKRGAVAETASYGLKEAWIRSEFAEVRYPVIEGLENLELQEEMNQAIYSAVNGYVVSAIEDGDQVTLDYEIKRMDDEILSVVVTGLQPHEKSTYDVMFSVNLDAVTSEEINASTLFMNDEASKQALTALLKSADNSFTSDFGPWLGIFFEAGNVNFFYLENDKAAVYNVVSLPVEAVEPYFKIPSRQAEDPTGKQQAPQAETKP